MKCPICDTEVSNAVTSCPVCGRIMEVEATKESTDSVNSASPDSTSPDTTSSDSTVFSIDGAFEPIPAEILHSDILKSVMKYNEQPKAEAEAPKPKAEAAPEQKQPVIDKAAPEQKQPVIGSETSEQEQPVMDSVAPEQKKKIPIMSKLGQFVKLRRA